MELKIRRRVASSLLASCSLLLVAVAWAGVASRELSLAAPSSVTYKLTHKMHVVEGTSRSPEGRVVLTPEGGAMVMIRAKVASFDSGNSNRDAHTKEVLEADRFPLVVFKGRVKQVSLPTGSAPVRVAVEGELEFHGVKRPLTVDLELVRREGGHLGVHAAFPISLEAHKVERPSLLFVKVEDALELSVTLELAEGK